MSTTPGSKKVIRQLFRRYVPEINSGVVEIVNVAREVGQRAYVAVRSDETAVDPVGGCTGVRGVRIKAMVSELKGEHLTVVRWDESPERFIGNALAGFHLLEIVLDPATRSASVTIDPSASKPAISEVQLIVELTGWRIHFRHQGE